MKKLASLMLSLSCTIASAADNRLVQRSLQDIGAAQEQASYILSGSGSAEDKERARYISDRLISAQDILRQAIGLNPGRPSNPPPRPPHSSPNQPNQNVELYKSDRCASELVAVANIYSDCASLGSTAVWGVKVNGQCYDIADTTATIACQNLKALSQPDSIEFYKSDRCASELVASASPLTDCSALNGAQAVWGVKINGQCSDVADTTLAKICPAMQAAGSPTAVKIFRNDRCASDLVAIVDRNTRCDSLAGLPAAWAVEVNGKCQDISDTDIVTACQRFR